LTQEELNEVVRNAIVRKVYTSKGKTLKFKEYMQTAPNPPTFVFTVNDEKLVHFSYRRFIEKCLRARFGFSGSPLILKFKKRYRGKIN
jgi:GTP-binding protein